ncbi:MAG: hypothetical protein IH586_02920 [Anaerolineaceae bacterium]|nr:hypothetical protein [Anaerolineaceae bacterium]
MWRVSGNYRGECGLDNLLGSGSLGRWIGFAILGMAIGAARNRTQEVAISRNRPFTQTGTCIFLNND